MRCIGGCAKCAPRRPVSLVDLHILPMVGSEMHRRAIGVGRPPVFPDSALPSVAGGIDGGEVLLTSLSWESQSGTAFGLIQGISSL